MFPLLLLIGLVAVPAARGAASDPRHFDTSSVGGRIDLGREGLFSPDDRAAYAGVSFDDGGWRVVSTDRSLLTYGMRHAWKK